MEILKHGLVLGSEPMVNRDVRNPHISLGVRPSGAWAISGDMDWVSEIEEWDLWEVRLREGDHVVIRPEFGPQIQEVQVGNTLPADRVWLIAQRVPVGFNEINQRQKRSAAAKKAAVTRKRNAQKKAKN